MEINEKNVLIQLNFQLVDANHAQCADAATHALLTDQLRQAHERLDAQTRELIGVKAECDSKISAV